MDSATAQTENTRVRAAAVVLAGGRGQRFGAGDPKQFLDWRGRPLFRHSLDTFLEHPRITVVVLVVPSPWVKRLQTVAGIKPERVVAGGVTRQASSRCGVNAVPRDCTHVLIHDAARPAVDGNLVNRVLDALSRYDAVVPALTVTDTLAELDSSGNISVFPVRERMRRIQTPQGFRLEVIREALERGEREGGGPATDDGSLVHRFRLARVAVVAGDETNIKVTTPEDLERLEQWREKEKG